MFYFLLTTTRLYPSVWAGLRQVDGIKLAIHIITYGVESTRTTLAVRPRCIAESGLDCHSCILEGYVLRRTNGLCL
jgi:hypothetical protein